MQAPKGATERAAQLRAALIQHAHRYYTLDAPEISDAAYDALSDADKDKVTRIYVNVGKSIAAFERAIRVKPNQLDAYAGGDLAALDADEKKSLHAFMANGCIQCHWGPRLTDDAFHVLRFPTGRQDGAADPNTGVRRMARCQNAAPACASVVRPPLAPGRSQPFTRSFTRRISGWRACTA